MFFLTTRVSSTACSRRAPSVRPGWRTVALCSWLLATGIAYCSSPAGQDESSATFETESGWHPTAQERLESKPPSANSPSTADRRLQTASPAVQWVPVPKEVTTVPSDEAAESAEPDTKKPAPAQTTTPPAQPEPNAAAPPEDPPKPATPEKETNRAADSGDAKDEKPAPTNKEEPTADSSEESVAASGANDWNSPWEHVQGATSLVYQSVLTGMEDWTKRFEIGGRYLAGNSEQETLNLGAKLEKHVSERQFAELDLKGDYGRNRGDTSSNRWTANGTYDFSQKGDWILYITSKNEFNEFRNLNWKGTLSSGIGYRFFNEKKKRLIARIGPAVTHEFFYNPTVHRTTPDILAEMELLWPLRERSELENKLTIHPSVDDMSVFRLSNQSGLLFRVDEDGRWKLKLGFWVDYDSVPAAGRQNADYTSSLSLVYVRK